MRGTGRKIGGVRSSRFTSSSTSAFDLSTIVRHGTKLDYDGLRKKAKTVLDESKYTQQEIAEELGVTRTSVAKAVTQAGPKFQKLQMRILEKLTDYEVDRRENVEFVIQRKD